LYGSTLYWWSRSFFGFTNNFIGGAEIVLKKFGKNNFYSRFRRDLGKTTS
jgi:hypothetical protein